MKKRALLCITVILTVFSVVVFAACSSPNTDMSWKRNFDTSLPSLLEEDGWYLTVLDEFDNPQAYPDNYGLNPQLWAPSPFGLRNVEYWCPNMIEVKEGKVFIHSQRSKNHVCDYCGVSEGIFTGGIEGRRTYLDENGEKKQSNLFTQAFGYFEATVKVPTGNGMWSAFWMQVDSMNQVGNKGRDGSEIDIFESSFINNPNWTGNCIHYDGYSDYHQSEGVVSDTGKNLYDGEFHTYALKWTPEEYVFFVDGVAVWATDAGGISRVPEFMRLTVEIRENGWGPYGQNIGKFKNADDGRNDFVIESVRVFQNKAFEPYIKSYDDYTSKT